VFSSLTKFEETEFRGNSLFLRTELQGEVSFDSAQFIGTTDFTPTGFRDRVSFYRSAFGPNSVTLFDGQYMGHDSEMFSSVADFTRMRIAQPCEVRFRKVSLHQCKFLETDVTRIQFTDVQWPRKGRFVSRAICHDESAHDSRYETQLLSQLYRRLQHNHIADYQYSLAGDFYVGEQVAMRREQWREQRYLSWLLNWAYFLASQYGQNIRVPFAWLVTALLVFPMLFLFGGIKLDKVHETNYGLLWSWNPLDLIFFSTAYWESVAVNLGIISLNRSSISDHLTDIFQQNVLVLTEVILVVTFVTLLLLALRRKFKRKSF
jgi:hypothetical protein